MKTVTLFKCLADESRLKLVMIIHKAGEACVCDLMTALDIDQPKTSRHLGDLRKCGLLKDERRGKWVYYSLHPDLPEWAASIIEITAKANNEILAPALKAMPTTSAIDYCR
ncbi:metalloregulator ArsR/SmtB family transcription factor [Alteromonas pelagimontana]|uniref:Metalloregulator ArsR/SmtB family transcription factor n=1 Tax=Alteromonas pelagimontana TaxID=1858656 RepID=A0A6M4MDB5_9ALTE|nr:metalloregulator ArsR/SmtB family transcription factor [Alteromonas pelagimontana]QJR81184.1 metalloregulator ArsR/SmtB family transcription factor [Alteromonas pelagimontana]